MKDGVFYKKPEVASARTRWALGGVMVHGASRLTQVDAAGEAARPHCTSRLREA